MTTLSDIRAAVVDRIETRDRPTPKRSCVQPSRWTVDLVDKLKTLWAAGYSSGRIASMIGRGITRGAVMGKVTRLGLPARGPRGEHRHQVRRHNRIAKAAKIVQRPARARPDPFARLPHMAVPPPHIDDIARVTFEGLEPHHCKFGIGDPKHTDFGFCGLPRLAGKPYCEGHVARCEKTDYVPRQQIRHERCTGAYTTAAAVQTFLEPV